MNTCSKPSLLLPFGQTAVRVELGVSAWWRTCRLRPAFPLYEVGDPALGQGGGLRHMVPHRLRDAWIQRRCKGRRLIFKCTISEKAFARFSLPFNEDLASAANSWMPTVFLESPGDFPDFGIISLSSNFTCKKRNMTFHQSVPRVLRICA